jgi:hypothetical protein
MNKPQSHRLSFDLRSVALARLRLALATTDSKAAWQRRYQGKAIGADLNGHPLAILSSSRCHAQPGCVIIQSP